jgi:cyclopropane fatty-acyl-phospholipid synthase-like methyltransferase
MFGIAIAQRFPQAEITALDWANVLEVAAENAEKMGVAGRYKTIAGSAFDVDLGGEYDVILLTNFLHHFDAATCENFLKKIHASLAEDGKVITLEFIPEADRISPHISAAFSLVMLCSTPQGDAYTFDELDKMFTAAGFSRSDLRRLVPIGDVMISYK